MINRSDILGEREREGHSSCGGSERLPRDIWRIVVSFFFLLVGRGLASFLLLLMLLCGGASVERKLVYVIARLINVELLIFN